MSTQMTQEEWARYQAFLEYEHNGHEKFEGGEEDWTPMKPSVKQEDMGTLLAQIVDATELETEFALLKFYVEFGVLDWMLEGTENQTIKDQLGTMRVEYRRVGEELRKVHEKNHNIALALGAGLQNKSGNAQASKWGVSHQQGNQNYYHHPQTHGQIHGQPGMPYQGYQHQQQHNPLMGLGKGLINKGLGFQVFGQPQPGYGAPPPPQPYPSPYPNPQY